MSEEIIQKGYQEHGLIIGKYQFYNIGSTTISTLKKFKIIPDIDYGEYENTKPDALLVDRRNKSKISVIMVMEHKSPEEFKTKKQKKEAVEQSNNYAQALKANIGIATDKSKFIWFNPHQKDTSKKYQDDYSITRSYSLIKHENDDDFVKSFDIDQKTDEKEITSLSINTKESIGDLELIKNAINTTNSKLKKEELQDPTGLAKQIWQDVWSVTGKDPEKCLYTFVELFIFKYLSDLGILTKDEKGNKIDFQYIYSLDKLESFKNYSANVRKHLKKMFKEGDDGTTIINGTILNPKVSEHSIVFHKILKKFNDFGEIKNIDPGFKSKIFEEFMKESISTKNWGRYFTPRNVIDAMISMSDLDKLEKGSKICDPACGVGGFILEPIKVKKDVNFFYQVKNDKVVSRFDFRGFDKGFERDEQLTIILAKANMLIFLSELIKNNDSITDSFSDVFNNTFKLTTNSIMGTLERIEKDKYDLILTNPPYVTSGSSNYKDRIKSDSDLKKFYAVNAVGIEGLFLEWIINSLKPGKKAFVIIPQSILERNADCDLREFILNECTLDAIISLPVKTFYTTVKKTYILAITKKVDTDPKIRASKKQTDPVLTYLIKDIGETLDGDRLSKEQNDLNCMVNLFNQFKGSKSSFTTDDMKCKIIPISKLRDNNYWFIDKLWSKEERKQLGIKEEVNEATVSELVECMKSVSVSLKTLESQSKGIKMKIKTNSVKHKTIEKKITDIFDYERGTSKYNKKYIHNNKGPYPVYSSQTVDEGIIGKITSFDYDAECLTWTTDGIYAGTVFHRTDPFSMTSHCGALFLKDEYKEKIDLKYLYYMLKNRLRHMAIGEINKRVTVERLNDVFIPIPITSNNEYDIKEQKRIVDDYKEIEMIQQKMEYAQEELASITKSNVIID